jgi:hypothetical protein
MLGESLSHLEFESKIGWISTSKSSIDFLRQTSGARVPNLNQILKNDQRSENTSKRIMEIG